MHLLLSMIENEMKLRRIRPKYICMDSINRSLTRILGYRRDKDLIIRTVSKLINDDVNRLELTIYLEAFTRGYEDREMANDLEEIALDKFDINEISQGSFLFHHTKDREVLKFKEELREKLTRDRIFKDRLEINVFTFCEKVIKKKIYSINESLDKQLIINVKDAEYIVNDEGLLTIPELTTIYQRVLKAHLRNMERLYITSYWYGVNNRIMSRY